MANFVGKAFGSGIAEVVNAVGDQINKKTELEADLLKTGMNNETQVQVAQAEINKVEAASSSLFVSGWRPAAGWTCVGGLAYQVMFRPVFGWIMGNFFGWTEPPSLDIETLMTLLFGMLGLGTFRTIEKSRSYKLN